MLNKLCFEEKLIFGRGLKGIYDGKNPILELDKQKKWQNLI